MLLDCFKNKTLPNFADLFINWASKNLKVGNSKLDWSSRRGGGDGSDGV